VIKNRASFNYTNYFYKRIRVLRCVDVYFFKQKIFAVKTKKTAELAERFIEIYGGIKKRIIFL